MIYTALVKIDNNTKIGKDHNHMHIVNINNNKLKIIKLNL